MTALYLHATHSLVANGFDEKNLRRQLKIQGVEARRFSKFTQLALLGVLPLKDKITADTAIFLASPFNSPDKFDKMFTQLFAQNLPSPLDFMANINNAATFQIAQTLELKGNSIFLTINNQTALQPLLLAWNDLQFEPHKSILIGWALESSDATQAEGSVWWLVSGQSEGALAKIRLETPKQTENRPHFLTFFSELGSAASFQQEIVL